MILMRLTYLQDLFPVLAQQITEYDELVELLTRVTVRLSLIWSGSKSKIADGHFVKKYLSCEPSISSRPSH